MKPVDSQFEEFPRLFKRLVKRVHDAAFRGWLRRRFRAQVRSTRGYSPQPLDALRREIEQNHEWAHASVPSVRDSWKRFWLWIWLRRRIRMAPPTPPYMKKVGPRHWVEVPKEIKEDFSKEFYGGTSGDPDYWKTHEPVFSVEDALRRERARLDSSECSGEVVPGPSASTDPSS